MSILDNAIKIAQICQGEVGTMTWLTNTLAITQKESIVYTFVKALKTDIERGYISANGDFITIAMSAISNAMLTAKLDAINTYDNNIVMYVSLKQQIFGTAKLLELTNDLAYAVFEYLPNNFIETR